MDVTLRVAAIFFGGILIALLFGLAWLYPTQNKVSEARFDPGGSTICDEFMRSMPPAGPDRVEAGKPCLEALPTLAPDDQLRIVNVYITQLPDFIPLIEIGELHTKLDPIAAMPFRAFTFRQEIHHFDPAQLKEAEQLLADAKESKNPAAIVNAIMTHQQFPFVIVDINSFDDRAMEQAVKIMMREGMHGLKPYAHNLWGLAHNLRGNYVESIEQYQLSRQGFNANQDYLGIALSFINLSYVYADFQDTEKAVKFARESIEVLDQHDPQNVSQRLAALIALGEHTSEAGRFEEALEAFDQVSELAQRENYYIPEEIRIARVRALFESGEREAAMTEAIALEEYLATNEQGRANRQLLVWMAARYSELGEIEKASRWFEEIKMSMGSNEASLVDLLKSEGNTSFALKFGNDLLLAALASGNVADNQKLTIELDRRNKAHRESSIVNAIAGHELQAKITNMTVEAERNESELQAYRLQLILAALIVIALGAFAFQLYRTSKTQQQLAETKETFLQEIHHRTKNNLQVLTSVLSLDIRRADRGERSKVAKLEAVNRVQMMGLIHDRVYNLSESAGPQIALGEFIDELMILLEASLGRKEVDLIWDVSGGAVDTNRITPLGLLICELITNSYKHAFGPEGGVIELSVRIDGDDFALQISDTGSGLEIERALNKKGSIGMQLAFDLAGQAGGKLTVESSDKGTIWSFI